MHWITEKDQERVVRMTQLLDQAYRYDNMLEGISKSSDGLVEVNFSMGTFMNREELVDEGLPLQPKLEVCIFTSVFGNEGKMKHFDSISEALQAIKCWHNDAKEEYEAWVDSQKFSSKRKQEMLHYILTGESK